MDTIKDALKFIAMLAVVVVLCVALCGCAPPAAQLNRNHVIFLGVMERQSEVDAERASDDAMTWGEAKESIRRNAVFWRAMNRAAKGDRWTIIDAYVQFYYHGPKEK